MRCRTLPCSIFQAPFYGSKSKDEGENAHETGESLGGSSQVS